MLSPETYISLSGVIHTLEETPITLPSGSTVLKCVVVGIPLAVLAHELSDWWVPKKVRVPILSFFRRRWVADVNNKAVDLMTFRNLALFIGIASVMHDVIPKVVPLDYLSDRFTSSAARRNVDKIITERRTNALAAGNQVIAAHAFDDAKTSSLRDDAIHRRAQQEKTLVL